MDSTVSPPAVKRDMDDIRAQYEELFGEKPDARRSAKRVQKSVDAKLSE